MKFYEFRQNNSGGGFIHDEEKGLSVSVFIQAPNASVANAIAEDKGIYFDGTEDDGPDCPCCGERWHRTGEWDAQETFEYDIGQANKYNWGYPTYVHYMDGRIEKFCPDAPQHDWFNR